MIFDVSEVEERIGYVFKDKALLRQCFTHSSYANEHNEKSNERLEFFGDGIIKFIQTEYLYNTNDYDEGLLTSMRQIVENDVFFLDVAKFKLKLVDDKNNETFMLLGEGLRRNAKYDEKLFSSLIESVVAGIYIDGGMREAKKFVKTYLIPDYDDYIKYEAELKKTNESNPKNELQEYVQKNKLGSIWYDQLAKCGPEHLPLFKVAAILNGTPIAEGTGENKKQAEKCAAKHALDKLKQDGKLL